MPKKAFQAKIILSKLIFLMSFCSAFLVLGSPPLEGIKIYQKDLHQSAKYKKKLADDLSHYRNAENLWEVLREQFSLSHYEKYPIVQDKIEWYLNNQDFLLRAASRAAPYLYYVSIQVKKKHLPAELVLLPIIESGYNPLVTSYMGASGLWQMMPSTASGWGIRQDSLYDGRRDIIASTSAALNHLAYLQNFFDGEWLLAIAAYNTGEGNVLAAIKRNIREGKQTDFWSLPVAQQTKNYVPSLLALAAIISHPEKYQVYFPPVRNAPYLAQIDVGRQINLKYAASLAGIRVKKIVDLNPGFNSYATSNKGPYKLVLPIENVEQFTKNLALSRLNTKYNWIRYKVNRRDSLLSVAKRFHTSIVELQKFNHLQDNQLKAGTELFIPDTREMSIILPLPVMTTLKRTTTSKTKNRLALLTHTFKLKTDDAVKTKNQKYELQPGDTVYMIRDQDSIQSIARKFHIRIQMLIAANKLSIKDFLPGKQIIIPTHQINPDILVQKTNILSNAIYMVKKDDTLAKIALHFHISESELRLVNLMAKRKLVEGEQLIIPNHLNS